MDLLAWADVRFVVLEAQPLVRRVTSRGAEVADPYQGLQVIGKTIELVREGSIVGTALQRVAYLQLAIVLHPTVFVPKNGLSIHSPSS